MSARVFCYGSNLASPRLLARASRARRVGVASLAGHALRFHKHGRDGSAKADAFFTGGVQDVVWGVVWELTNHDKRALDGYEGLGTDYLQAEVRLLTPVGRLLRAITYRASPAKIDVTLRPFSWYHAYVLAGAREHCLPHNYIASLESVDVLQDPDRERHARETRLLDGMAADSSLADSIPAGALHSRGDRGAG